MFSCKTNYYVKQKNQIHFSEKFSDKNLQYIESGKSSKFVECTPILWAMQIDRSNYKPDILLKLKKYYKTCTRGIKPKIGFYISGTTSKSYSDLKYYPDETITKEEIGITNLLPIHFGSDIRRQIINISNKNTVNKLVDLIIKKVQTEMPFSDFIMLDNVSALYNWYGANANSKMYYYLQTLRNKAHENNLELFINVGHAAWQWDQYDWITLADGISVEQTLMWPIRKGNIADPEKIAKELKAYRYILDKNKTILLFPYCYNTCLDSKACPNNKDCSYSKEQIQDNKVRIDYLTVAAALLIREPRDKLFIAPKSKFTNNFTYNWITWVKDFGKPISPAQYEGFIWTREFQNATLTVDFKDENIIITNKKNFRKFFLGSHKIIPSISLSN